MCVRIGVKQFTADLEDNSSSDAFLEKLKGGELNLVMEDYGSFEKVADLPWSLPRNDKRITTEPGDIILYQGDKLTIYYAENTWEFTRIGKIHIDSYEDFRDALGDGSAEVSFWLEWTE
ncbi:MAG: hypothetical protein IJ091_04025 [Oscillospiraceae bacterium]|nr:hypothetical protein [Oscillospiraceae bacterium]